MIPKIWISEPDTEPEIGPDPGSTEPVSRYSTTLSKEDQKVEERGPLKGRKAENEIELLLPITFLIPRIDRREAVGVGGDALLNPASAGELRTDEM